MLRPRAQRAGLLRPRVHVRATAPGVVRFAQDHLELDARFVVLGEEQRVEQSEFLQYGEAAQVARVQHEVGERGAGHEGVAAHDMVTQPGLGRAGQVVRAQEPFGARHGDRVRQERVCGAGGRAGSGVGQPVALPLEG